jgi:hypothetical protein
LDVVCAHLVGSRPFICSLEYLLEQLFHLSGGDMAIDLTSGVLDPTIFPARMDLLLQRSHLVGQEVGDNADSDQPVLLELADLFS